MPTIVPSTATPTIIPTAPTVSPSISLTPTYLPTYAIEISIFDAPINDKVVKEKTRYYFVSFASYFVALFMIFYLYKLSGVGKRAMADLYESAYNSKYYKRHTKNTTVRADMQSIRAFHDTCRVNSLVSDSIKVDNEMKVGNRTQSLGYFNSKGFVSYINNRRYLIGCEPIMCPSGITINLWFTKLQFSPGYIENVLVFLCCNHQFFNMIYCVKGDSRIDANARILVYVIKESIVFVLCQFLTALVQYYSIDYFTYLNPLVKLFVITPISIVAGFVLVWLYAAPCARTNATFMDQYKCFRGCLVYSGRLCIIPIIIFLVGALVSACILTTSRRIPYILIEFFVTVQLFSILLNFIRLTLGFYDNYFFRVSVCNVLTVLSIGDLFVERIVSEELVCGIDFAVKRHYILGFELTRILCRVDAIKRGWIIAGPPEDPSSNDVYNEVFEINRLS